jgi:hypothetical protein
MELDKYKEIKSKNKALIQENQEMKEKLIKFDGKF